MSTHIRPFGVPDPTEERVAKYGLVSGYIKPADSGAIVWKVSTPHGSEVGIAPDYRAAKGALYPAILRASGRDT